jgi:hypothetical protein
MQIVTIVIATNEEDEDDKDDDDDDDDGVYFGTYAVLMASSWDDI